MITLNNISVEKDSNLFTKHLSHQIDLYDSNNGNIINDILVEKSLWRITFEITRYHPYLFECISFHFQKYSRNIRNHPAWSLAHLKNTTEPTCEVLDPISSWTSRHLSWSRKTDRSNCLAISVHSRVFPDVRTSIHGRYGTRCIARVDHRSWPRLEISPVRHCSSW